MTTPTTSSEPFIVRKDRILPQQAKRRESVTPLSLLDATTANLGLTSAIWLLERPVIPTTSIDLPGHLRTALRTALNAYPQWTGFLESVLSIDKQNLAPEISSFPSHAKGYGRVYVRYGSTEDPGIEFVEAKSTAIVDDLYSIHSAKRRPVWIRQEPGTKLTQFVPLTVLVNALQSNGKDADGLYKPNMAIQCTRLACGGLVLAAKIAHPLADITALAHFIRDWASVSRAMLTESPLPELTPIFEPLRLDACAAGDIDADDFDPAIVQEALNLPLHRYDWWAPPAQPPPPFPPDLPMAGTPLPWDSWNTKAIVDQYTVHFSREQIDYLWRTATHIDSDGPSQSRISKHDALLAHIWSCVVRARNLQEDPGLVHCNLVLGTRPVLQLGDSFIGSPTMMLNIEMTASHVASEAALRSIANRVRETIAAVNNAQRLGAHLHSIAYEKSPQRIWQGFLGQRHIMVTTWARAGLYDIDFGLGSRIRYADGVVPCLDGCILIVDGPPIDSTPCSDTGRRTWTDNGVEVTLPLCKEDLERLLQDPLLLP